MGCPGRDGDDQDGIRHEGSWVWRVVGQPQDCPPPTSALLLQANDDALQDYVCCWVTMYALHKFT